MRIFNIVKVLIISKLLEQNTIYSGIKNKAMSFKTIFIIVVSVLVTVILMNNTDEIQFWIFGNAKIPKLAVLGFMFGLGAIVGYLAGRPKKSYYRDEDNENDHENMENAGDRNNKLSDEDREYIS